MYGKCELFVNVAGDENNRFAVVEVEARLNLIFPLTSSFWANSG